MADDARIARGWARPCGVDAEDFARGLRRFALDIHRTLKDPAATPEDLIGLHRRAWSLLLDAPPPTSGELQYWLLSASRAIGASLQVRWPGDPAALAA